MFRPYDVAMTILNIVFKCSTVFLYFAQRWSTTGPALQTSRCVTLFASMFKISSLGFLIYNECNNDCVSSQLFLYVTRDLYSLQKYIIYYRHVKQCF